MHYVKAIRNFNESFKKLLITVKINLSHHNNNWLRYVKTSKIDLLTCKLFLRIIKNETKNKNTFYGKPNKRMELLQSCWIRT